MVVALLGVGVLIAIDALFAVRDAFEDLVTYRADLTTGSGEFSASDDADVSRFYATDGYHLVTRSPGWALAGVFAPRVRGALGVEVEVRALTAPVGAAFGPFVWDVDTGSGYGFLVDGTGNAAIVEFTPDGDVAVVAAAAAPTLNAGAHHVLTVTCVIAAPSGGRTVVTGYVDGAQVASGTPDVRIGEVSVTGMTGYVEERGPAEWVVSRFARLGPGDLPPDAPGSRDTYRAQPAGQSRTTV